MISLASYCCCASQLLRFLAFPETCTSLCACHSTFQELLYACTRFWPFLQKQTRQTTASIMTPNTVTAHSESSTILRNAAHGGSAASTSAFRNHPNVARPRRAISEAFLVAHYRTGYTYRRTPSCPTAYSSLGKLRSGNRWCGFRMRDITWAYIECTLGPRAGMSAGAHLSSSPQC